MFHNHSNYNFSVDLAKGVKAAKDLEYITGFVVANKGSKLISDWLNLILVIVDQTIMKTADQSSCMVLSKKDFMKIG